MTDERSKRAAHAWRLSGDSLKALWRFSGDSLEILWRFSGDFQKAFWTLFGNLWRLSGDSLEALWRLPGDSLGALCKLSGDSLGTFFSGGSLGKLFGEPASEMRTQSFSYRLFFVFCFLAQVFFVRLFFARFFAQVFFCKNEMTDKRHEPLALTCCPSSGSLLAQARLDVNT